MSREALIFRRIENIERELAELKRLLSNEKRENFNLRGIWKGADISDEEIEQAKRSLFSGIDKYESG